MLSRLTFSAATALVLAGSGLAQADGHVTADTVVASVNGTEITLGHLIIQKQGLPQQYQQIPSDVLFDGLLNQTIQQTLLGQTLEGTPKSVQLALDNQERSLKAAQAIEDAVEAGMTDEKIRAAYDAHDWGLEYQAAHILVATEEEANALIDQLSDGADFAELARENSTGPSGPNGGDLGWFPQGAMVPAFDEAVTSMEVGAIAGPVQTQFGWHVIRLNETRPVAPTPFEQTGGQFVEQVQRDLVEARIQELSANADITRMDLESFDTSVLNNTALISE